MMMEYLADEGVGRMTLSISHRADILVRHPYIKTGVALPTLPANHLNCRKLPILPLCEPLEIRRLLATGVVEVKGTPDADVIKISKSGSTITVKIGATATIIPPGPVHAIRIRAFEGNDSISVGGTLKIPLIVYGGAGNDTIFGSLGADKLSGGDGDDSIHGDRADDTLGGGAGNDKLFGDAGADVIKGDDGNDSIIGDGGDDNLKGGAGNDTINGGEKDDSVEGGAGNDAIHGNTGRDSLRGGADLDTIFGDTDNDQLFGGDGNDSLDGGQDDDMLDGGEGNDTLFDHSGSDIFQGQGGDDSLDSSDGTRGDGLNGGSGTNTVTKDLLDFESATV